jgi:putative acetyltransferase
MEDLAFTLAGPADVPRLAALYAEAARLLGPQVYSPAQVAAWVSAGELTPRFHDYILGAQTWVARRADASIVGFCGIDAQGEVRSLYVRADLGRRGLGTRLLAHALSAARAAGRCEFRAWATPFSRPVFERAGFRLERIAREPYQGVIFDRYRMVLAPPPIPATTT